MPHCQSDLFIQFGVSKHKQKFLTIIFHLNDVHSFQTYLESIAVSKDNSDSRIIQLHASLHIMQCTP